MDFIAAIFALIAGLFAGWFLAQKRSSGVREELSVLKAQAKEQKQSSDREKEFFEKSLAEMKSQFLGAAQTALRANNEQFLQNTEIKIKPLSDALKALQEKTGDLEKKRENAYGQLSEQIKGMKDAAAGMLKSSESMSSLLKGSSQVRGNWGEQLLRNVVEFSGMVEHVHFSQQTTVEDRRRPDMIIKLPGGAGIPVDSKCPFAAFQQAKDATDPAQARSFMEAHAKAIRKHFTDLSGKDYSSSIQGEIDFTVMFMPGDHLLEAALAVDPGLQDEALRKKVLITNPVSLVALLRTVRVYWRQEETDRNAQKIADAARELYERTATWMEHVGKIGKGLKTAVEAHNRSVGSWERRVAPAGKKMRDLKVQGTELKSLDDSKVGPSEIDEDLRDLPGLEQGS